MSLVTSSSRSTGSTAEGGLLSTMSHLPSQPSRYEVTGVRGDYLAWPLAALDSAEGGPQGGQGEGEDREPDEAFGYPQGGGRGGEQAGDAAGQQAEGADGDERGLVPQEQGHGRQVDQGDPGPGQRALHQPGQAVAEQQGQAALGDAEGHRGQGGRVQVGDVGAVHADHAGRVAGPGDQRGGGGGAAGQHQRGDAASWQRSPGPGDAEQVGDEPAGREVDPAEPGWPVLANTVLANTVQAEPEPVGGSDQAGGEGSRRRSEPADKL